MPTESGSSNSLLRICGNGNSLKGECLISDDSIKYMVVNRHVLAENYTDIRPSYYILADPHFFDHAEGKSILEKINEKTQWPMLLLTPYGSGVDKLVTNQMITTVFYTQEPFEGFDNIGFKLYDRQLAVPHIRNVINAAIMVGMWMGYKKIELYGVEHSWTKDLFVNSDNDVCLYNSHFFDKGKVDYRRFSDIQDGQDYPLHKCLLAYAYMFETYWKIRAYSDYTGCKILNCTKDSFIDAFERKR
nr:hypothetical protein [uncultured Bacteroides sp.]